MGTASCRVCAEVYINSARPLRGVGGPPGVPPRVNKSNDSLVPFAAGDADELLDAAGVAQGFGVLHVLGDDFVQRAADGGDRVVRHGLAGGARRPGVPAAGGVVVAAAAASR